MKTFVTILLCSLVSCGSLRGATDYLEIAVNVAEKVVKDSSFEFEMEAIRPVNGIQTIDFETHFEGKTGRYYAVSEIVVKTSGDYRFGISSKGPIKIWMDQELVYENDSIQPYYSQEIAYGMHKHTDVFDHALTKGHVSIWVEVTASPKGCGFELQPLESNGTEDTRLQFYSPISGVGEAELPWVVSGPYSKSSLVPDKGLLSAVDSTKDLRPWQTLGLKFGPVLSPPDGVDFRWHAYTEWHYANGATLWSMLYLADVSGVEYLREHVQKFCKFTLENKPLLKHYYDQYHMRRVANFRMFRMSMLDDSGAPALPFIELFLDGALPEAKEVLSRSLVQITTEQIRLDDGTLARPEPEQLSVWADDMFMAVPFLLRASKMSQNPQHLDDGLEQILRIHRHLYDSDSGLFYHGWLDSRKEHSSSHWGRANGWCAWAMADALMYTPSSHRLYSEIQQKYKNHMESLATYQGSQGLWHQVLDRPDSWEETSCSAMFLLAMARGVKLGWLDHDRFMPVIENAWEGIKSKIEPDGRVNGICQGTGIGESDEFYEKRKARPHDPRGVGAVITAATEMHLLYKN